MPFNLQFAFLGSGHNYCGRVMRVNDDGVSQGGPALETFELPDAFVKKLSKMYSKVFVFNIRGHDHLSHYGEWKDDEDLKSAYLLEASKTAISELKQLERLMAEVKSKDQVEPEIRISFGPHSSSFFVDLPGIKRYKCHNLAQVSYGLDDVIQRSRDTHGHGDILEVMMNAVGGWVVLFKKGLNEEKFAFGGSLPRRLEDELRRTQMAQAEKKGALLAAFGPKTDNSIYRVYLNHQNKDDYVLLYNDGRCFASLHADFRSQLERLVKVWAEGNELPNYAFRFSPSSEIPESMRKRNNAAYYSRRGMFHLSKAKKENSELALKYLREASREQENEEEEHDPNIERQLAMAVLAVRQERGADKITRARKTGPPRQDTHDGDTQLKNEYVWVVENFPDIEQLKAEVKQLRVQQVATTSTGAFDEWSYGKANAGNQVHEIDTGEIRYFRRERQAHEMEGDLEHVVSPVERVVSHELSVERSRSSRDDVGDEDLNKAPNGPQKKSRMASKLIHRFQISHGKVE